MHDPVQRRWERYWSKQPPHERDASWLSPYRERLRACGGPLLELGSGAGVDTTALSQLGALVALDYARPALVQLHARVPNALCTLADLRAPLPFRDRAFGAAVASLCLHYFDAATTHAVLAEIRRCLRPRGLLLARVNSSRDAAYGASGHPAIEPGFFDVGGRPKRFFDQAAVEAFFGAHFALAHVEHAPVGIVPEKWAFTVLAAVPPSA